MRIALQLNCNGNSVFLQKRQLTHTTLYYKHVNIWVLFANGYHDNELLMQTCRPLACHCNVNVQLAWIIHGASGIAITLTVINFRLVKWLCWRNIITTYTYILTTLVPSKNMKTFSIQNDASLFIMTTPWNKGVANYFTMLLFFLYNTITYHSLNSFFMITLIK